MDTCISEMDDHMVVEALLLRNQRVTQYYLYVKCYPLFKSVYDNYYTDCQTCIEFINELYVHLLTPSLATGLCKLQTFQFGSTLLTWLKTVAVYYCFERYRRRQKVKVVEQFSQTKDGYSDRFDQVSASIYSEEPEVLEQYDTERLLDMMPNKRYSMILRLRYIDGLSNEETAAALNMTMDNYYNKHRRAKIQFNEITQKEQTI